MEFRSLTYTGRCGFGCVEDVAAFEPGTLARWDEIRFFDALTYDVREIFGCRLKVAYGGRLLTILPHQKNQLLTSVRHAKKL